MTRVKVTTTYRDVSFIEVSDDFDVENDTLGPEAWAELTDDLLVGELDIVEYRVEYDFDALAPLAVVH